MATLAAALLAGCERTQDGDPYEREPVRPHLAAASEAAAIFLTRGLTGTPENAVGQLQPPSALRELTAREILLFQGEPAPLEEVRYEAGRREIDQSHGNPFAAMSMLTSLAVLPLAGNAHMDAGWFQESAVGTSRALLTSTTDSSGPGQVEWIASLRLARAAAATGHGDTAARLRLLVRDTLAPRVDQICRADNPVARRGTGTKATPASDGDAEAVLRAAAISQLHRDTGLCSSSRAEDRSLSLRVVDRYCVSGSNRVDLFTAIELAQAQGELFPDSADRRCADTLRTVLDTSLRSQGLMSGGGSVPLHAVLVAHRTLQANRVAPAPLPAAAKARVHAAIALAGALSDSSQPVAFTEAVLGSVTSVWRGTSPAAPDRATLRRRAAELADASGIDATLTRALAALSDAGSANAAAPGAGDRARRMIADRQASAATRLSAHLEAALHTVGARQACEALDPEGLRRDATEVAGHIAEGSALGMTQLVIWFTALAQQPTACPTLRDAADNAATAMTDAVSALGHNTNPRITAIHNLLAQWRTAEKSCQLAGSTATDTYPRTLSGFLAEPAESRAELALTANTLGLGPLSLTYLEMRFQRLLQAGCGHPLLTWFLQKEGAS